jgi:hypothetical protein
MPKGNRIKAVRADKTHKVFAIGADQDAAVKGAT